MNSTYFSFKNKYYLQVYGLPMSGSCSKIFSDIVMDDLETECLEKLDFTPVAYYRYIDDIFAIIPEDEIDHMLNVFNSYNSRLQFTHELEINQGLSFLDLHVSRDNGKIITNWYQKPTSS